MLNRQFGDAGADDAAQCAYCGKLVTGIHTCTPVPTLYMFVYRRAEDGGVTGAVVSSQGEFVYMNHVRAPIYLNNAMTGGMAKRWYNERYPNGYTLCNLLDCDDEALEANEELMAALEIAARSGS